MNMKMGDKDQESPRGDNAQKKLLCVLEKLKEEWNILPKEGEFRIHSDNFYRLIEECGLNDFYQLESILKTLGEAGLINFEVYNEAR